MGIHCKDLDGREFKSLKEMAEFHHVDYQRLRRRFADLDKPLEEVLDFDCWRDASSGHSQKIMYNGKSYSSLRKLSKLSPVTPGTFCNRLRQGYTVKEAVETPAWGKYKTKD